MQGTIGDYTILGELGQGGMGAVLRVRHRTLGVVRALKVMGRPSDAKALARFERESRNLALVKHPNLIKIHEACLEPGRAWFVMDLVEGESLSDRLGKTGALEWRDALGLAIGVCRGVAALHGAGVLHRDLKPSNVMIDAQGRPMVIDLGLALAPSSDERLTRTGAVVGTLRYLSPEAIVGGEPSPAMDVYALGLMLYEMLTGEQAVAQQSSWQAQTAAILTESRPGPGSVVLELPARLDAVCSRAMAYAPAERYPDAAALADALEAVLRNPGPTQREARARARTYVVIGALGVLAAATLVASLLPKTSAPPPLAEPSAPPAARPEPRRAALSAADRRDAEAELRDLRREDDPRRRVELADLWLERFAALPEAESARRARAQALFEVPLARAELPGGVAAAALLGEDRLLIVGLAGDVQLRTTWPGRELRSWRLKFAPWVAAVSPDERYALIGGTAGEVMRLPLAGGSPEPLTVLGPPPVNHIAIHPQGSFALVAHSEFVHVFALPGLEPRLRLAHGGSTRYAEFSPDGRRVATGCGSALTGGRKTDLSARLWSFPAGDELHRIETSAKVSSGAFSSDGARLAIGTGSAQIVVVDVSTGARLQELKTESLESKRAALLSGTVAHSFTVRGVAFLPGDRRLVSCSPNRLGGGELRLWDGTSYVELPPGPGLLRPPMESACQWEGMLISPTRDRVVLWEREKTGRLEVWALPE